MTNALVDIEADRQLQPSRKEALRPCELTPEVWESYCQQKGTHAADLETLYSCGCVVAYCETGYTAWQSDDTFDLEGFQCDRHDMLAIIVMTRGLR